MEYKIGAITHLMRIGAKTSRLPSTVQNPGIWVDVDSALICVGCKK